MTVRPTFIDRLIGGPLVLVDEAVNNELTDRGLVFNTDDRLRVDPDRPEVLEEIHAAYECCGAELHIAGTKMDARGEKPSAQSERYHKKRT